MEKRLLKVKKRCTGCSSCYCSCPVGAIDMVEDKFGFLKAVVNEDKCIHCNKCEQVCPQISFENNNSNEPMCYAIKMDDKIRMSSSSGGVFTAIAEKVIEEGGIVFGAQFSSDFQVEHTEICSIDDIDKVRKSKYYQSNQKGIFRKIKEYLSEGKIILYSGCPCQIAGLKTYLGKEYENLITADILCKGVPSRKVFFEFIEQFVSISEIESIDFRDKKYGWNCDNIVVYKKNGEVIHFTTNDYETRLTYSWYTRAFLESTTLNECCFDCKYAEAPRPGDVTIGDFWGIWEIDASFFDKRGVSLALANSKNGEVILEKLISKGVNVREEKFDLAKKWNRFGAKLVKSNKFFRFQDWYGIQSTGKLLRDISTDHFDVGLVGLVNAHNQGAALLSYALYSSIKEFGYSVLLIGQHNESEWKQSLDGGCWMRNPFPQYVYSKPAKNVYDMAKFNDLCDMFVLSSDQLLSRYFFAKYGSCFDLNWVYSTKKKIGYGVCLSKEYPTGSESHIKSLGKELNAFDFLSVREISAQKMTKEIYDIDVDIVCEPVFLHNAEFYYKLIERSGINCSDNSKYYLSAFWHPSKEKYDVVNLFSNRDWKNIVEWIANDNFTRLYGVDEVHYKTSVEEWLQFIAGSEFVLTDSYHTMCMAIIFKKKFLVFAYEEDSYTRFSSLLRLLGLENYLVDSFDECLAKMDNYSAIDYQEVYKKLDSLVDYSKEWINKALLYSKNEKILSDRDQMIMKFNDLYEKQIEEKENLLKQILKLENENTVMGKKIDEMEKTTECIEEMKKDINFLIRKYGSIISD